MLHMLWVHWCVAASGLDSLLQLSVIPSVNASQCIYPASGRLLVAQAWQLQMRLLWMCVASVRTFAFDSLKQMPSSVRTLPTVLLSH